MVLKIWVTFLCLYHQSQAIIFMFQDTDVDADDDANDDRSVLSSVVIPETHVEKKKKKEKKEKKDKKKKKEKKQRRSVSSAEDDDNDDVVGASKRRVVAKRKKVVQVSRIVILCFQFNGFFRPNLYEILVKIFLLYLRFISRVKEFRTKLSFVECPGVPLVLFF